MRMAARFIHIVSTLALAFSLSVDLATGQAMIGYGHGVAKAAGAGAAVGAGVGGALTGLGNPLSKAADRRGVAAKRNGAVQRQTVPVRRGPVAWDVPDQGFGGGAPVTLIGGVQANGATDVNRQLTLLEPSENLAVISVSWGGPGATNSEDSEAAISTGELSAENPEEAVAEAKPTVPIVLRSAGQSGSSGGKSAQQPGAAASAVLPEGVTVGSTIEQLLEKLGRPHLSFRGVAGEGYTDQYVFELPEGGHLVVYVLNGVVAHISVV